MNKEMKSNTTWLFIMEWNEADQIRVSTTTKDASFYHITTYGQKTNEEADEIDDQAQRWSPYDFVCPMYFDNDKSYNDSLANLKSKGANI